MNVLKIVRADIAPAEMNVVVRGAIAGERFDEAIGGIAHAGRHLAQEVVRRTDTTSMRLPNVNIVWIVPRFPLELMTELKISFPTRSKPRFNEVGA